MKYLSSDKIIELNSKPVHLSSHFSNGKLLTIDSKKNVVLKDIGGGKDQLWKLIPVGNNGFIISSSKNDDIICHYMKDQGEVSVKPKNTVKKFLINKKVSVDPPPPITVAIAGNDGELSKDEDTCENAVREKEELTKDEKEELTKDVKKLKEELIKDDCIWSLGKDGEIYQRNPNGGERYLWLADNKLFVTLDGFLAESWIAVSNIEQFKLDVKKITKHVLNDPPEHIEEFKSNSIKTKVVKSKLKKTKVDYTKIFIYGFIVIIILLFIIFITMKI
jgi:hypothetical protein